MKCLIITCAGMSTRFSRSVGYDCLKCTYSDGDFSESILYRSIMNNNNYFDKIIIIGGFKFDELKKCIDKYFLDIVDKIVLVNNQKYAQYGSGYSLLLGLKKAFEYDTSEVIFMEGDLYINKNEFKILCEIDRNVITTNNEPIMASKAVAFYTDIEEKIHYIYDTEHNALQIREPFLSISNSGQIWKFKDIERLKNICENLDQREKEGTNLVIIQKYFGALKKEQYNIFNFSDWINCNTIDDYKKIKKC